MAPEKWVWLACMVACSTTQFALVARLVVRKFKFFPVLTTYLFLHLFAPAHWLSWWSLRWELNYAMWSLATAWEGVRGTFWVVTMEPEGDWEKFSCLGIAAMLLGAGLLTSPSPYAGMSDQRIYYLHLYTDLVCGSMLAGALLLAWRHSVEVLRPQVWNNAILLVWFAIRCWADRQDDPRDFFSTATLVTLVSGTCLAAWHSKVAR
jgi:hypothetical protein